MNAQSSPTNKSRLLRREAAPADLPAELGDSPQWAADPKGYAFVKRLGDVGGALLLLALGFPVMLAIALLIKLTSPGPVLFRQVRLGRHGDLFSMFKFRTMVINAERQLALSPELTRAFEATFKIARDPRVTPLGAFLRRASLDELPQVINVLGGSMSLIGPRPIVPAELVKYGPWGEKLLTVKPGLGGMWQANGRSDTTYAERVALDTYYVDHRSVRLDLSLLAKTVVSVLTCRGSS